MSEASDLNSSFIVVSEEPLKATFAAPANSSVNHESLSPNYRPGTLSSYAHDWSDKALGGKLSVHGRHFLDVYGRVCNLRGVNLSGSSKTPVNHSNETFPADHRSVTFVGRPFPVSEAHEHFSRLRRWGLTFVRFLVTWEAVEHQGPGQYDTEYLNYLRDILSLLPNYGIKAFVSLHQDVWSRYSGGSGAPAWTLEATGFDIHQLEISNAAWLLGVKGGGHTEEERGIWPCGYQKLSAATMATCFWAGDTFAPKLKIKRDNGQEVSIQTFLQDAFLDMFEVLARTVSDLDGILGLEVMNEPHRGYIDLKSLHSFDYNTDLHLSHVPSAFQSFTLGAGHPTSVPVWTRSFPMPTRRTGQELLNKEGRRVWRADGPTSGKCLWEMHGVWGWDVNKDEGVVLRESYFVKDPATGRPIDWYKDFYYPFLKKWSNRLEAIIPADKLLFVEPIPNEFCPASWTSDNQVPNMVFAPHWYDLNALFTKAFGDFSVNVQGLSRGMFPLRAFYWGQRGARENFTLQIRNIVEAGYRSLGEKPIIIGECGIPMDMNKREAFDTDDWTWQRRMMDAMMTALERTLVGFTLWNYNPDNSDVMGDDWNGENFSWFSRRRGLPASLLTFEQTSPTLDNGGRILDSVVRPYPAKTAGVPLSFEYEMTTGEFMFEWAIPHSHGNGEIQPLGVNGPPLSGLRTIRSRETEIFIPSFHTHGRKLVVRGLSEKDSFVYDETRQTLYVVVEEMTPGKKHKINVSLDPPLSPNFEVNHFWGDFGGRIVAFMVATIAIIFYWAFK